MAFVQEDLIESPSETSRVAPRAAAPVITECDPNLLAFCAPALRGGYFPDALTRESLLKSYQITANITIDNEDLLLVSNFHTNQTCVGYIFSVGANVPWTFVQPIEISADLNSFERNRCTSGMLTIFSDTISTTNTNLSGRMTTVDMYDMPDSVPSYQSLSSYAIGPQFRVVNVPLSEGTTSLMRPYYLPFASRYSSALDGRVTCNIDWSQDSPLCTFDGLGYPPPGTSTTIWTHTPSPFVAGALCVVSDLTVDVDVRVTYTTEAGAETSQQRVRPGAPQLIARPPSSMLTRVEIVGAADPQEVNPGTLRIYVADPVLRRNGVNRTVTILQGSIGTKNINISGVANYQLIPTPDNLRQVTLEPCPASTFRPLEAFNYLLAQTAESGLRIVYSRGGYLEWLSQMAPTVCQHQYYAGHAAQAMGHSLGFFDAWRWGIKGLKRLGLSPGRLATKGIGWLEEHGLAEDRGQCAARGHCSDTVGGVTWDDVVELLEESSAIATGEGLGHCMEREVVEDDFDAPASVAVEAPVQTTAVEEQSLDQLLNPYGIDGATWSTAARLMLSKPLNSVYMHEKLMYPRVSVFMAAGTIDSQPYAEPTFLVLTGEAREGKTYFSLSEALVRSGFVGTKIENVFIDSRWKPTTVQLRSVGSLFMMPDVRRMCSRKSHGESGTGGVLKNVFVSFYSKRFTTLDGCSWTGALINCVTGTDPFAVCEAALSTRKFSAKAQVDDPPFISTSLQTPGGLDVKYEAFCEQCSGGGLLEEARKHILSEVTRRPEWTFRVVVDASPDAVAICSKFWFSAGPVWHSSVNNGTPFRGCITGSMFDANPGTPFSVLFTDLEPWRQLVAVTPVCREFHRAASARGELYTIVVKDSKPTAVQEKRYAAKIASFPEESMTLAKRYIGSYMARHGMTGDPEAVLEEYLIRCPVPTGGKSDVMTKFFRNLGDNDPTSLGPPDTSSAYYGPLADLLKVRQTATPAVPTKRVVAGVVPLDRTEDGPITLVDLPAKVATKTRIKF